MSGLQISIPQRMSLVRVTLVLSLVISVGLSFLLWTGARTFPEAPVFEHDPIPAPFDLVFIALAVICWLLSLFLKGERGFIFVSFLLCFFLVLFDLNRLQPWFYMYNAMLAVFVFYNGRVDDPNRYTSFFILLQIMLASVYFFTGISQMNRFFLNTSFADVIQPLKSLVSERQFLFLKRAGVFSPYLFMFVGVGLIVSPVRYLAITLGCIIHLLLLVFLFPSAQHTNYALWFSNLSFLVLLLLLFSGKTKQRYFSPVFLFQQPLFYVVIFLFVIMPWFNIVNQWPDFLSSNVHSGNNQSMMITLTQKAKDKLPFYQRSFCVPLDSTSYTLDYKRWINHELKADYFPADEVFNSIYVNIKELGGGDVKEIELHLQPKQKLLCKP